VPGQIFPAFTDQGFPSAWHMRSRWEGGVLFYASKSPIDHAILWRIRDLAHRKPLEQPHRTPKVHHGLVVIGAEPKPVLLLKLAGARNQFGVAPAIAGSGMGAAAWAVPGGRALLGLLILSEHEQGAAHGNIVPQNVTPGQTAGTSIGVKKLYNGTANHDTGLSMPRINARSDLDDHCTCGHVRGEHLRPTGGAWHAAYCLIVGCHCGQFQDSSTDGSTRPPRTHRTPGRGKKAA
jgi:hypothetical protein